MDTAAARVDVVDTVGAGDSFMAALISTLTDRGLTGADARRDLDALDKDEVRQILRYAAAAAGVTVSRSGADLPTKDDLPKN